MAPRTLVVHATNLLARGYFTTSTDRQTEDGRPTNALYAATRALLAALSFKEPEHAVAVVDTSFDRQACPPLLSQQLDPFSDILAAHGVQCVPSDDALHVVGSYTRAALDAGHDVVVVGSDKRLAQLVGDRVWWYDGYKDVRYTPELVRKRFEVGPDHVAQWLALVGDDDALPGVKGIGKKGATTLIEEHGSVLAALEVAAEIGGRTGKALLAAHDDVGRELERARVHVDRELPVPLASLTHAQPESSVLNALYSDWAFYALLAKGDDEAELDVAICADLASVQAAVEALGDGPCALHALTTDPSPPRGELAGLAVCQEAGRGYYFPFGGKDALASDDAAPLLAWLGSEVPKVGHDVKVVALAVKRFGVDLGGVIGDSACASHLADPSRMAPHDLSLLARRKLHRAIDEEDQVRGVGRRRRSWTALKTERVASYAVTMAEAALALWHKFSETFMSEPDQRALLDEYLALSETLVRMEQHGIGCDAEDLGRAGADFEVIEKELETEIFALAGRELNLGSTKQLGTLLFEELELPVMKRTKTGWSTATEALVRIENAHPIVSLVIRWRRLRRLRDSWVTALTAAIDSDGRVRSSFHPARSFSGRLVNSSPDLGRVPGRTKEMARIRHAFRTPAGRTLLSVDFKQLGLYVLAHLTEDPALVEPLRNGDDMHLLTACAVLELPADRIGRPERQIGKVVNFATFAGQGASALGMQLGVTPAEAKEYVARFDRRYSVVRSFQEEQLRLAKERGYIVTIAGRRWPIGDLASLDTQMLSYAERLARRATHEGSVADVSRRALLRADQALRAAGLEAQPLLQVHDEVLFEVPDAELEEAAKVAADAMQSAFSLVVPLRVTCKAGPSWSELKVLAPLT